MRKIVYLSDTIPNRVLRFDILQSIEGDLVFFDHADFISLWDDMKLVRSINTEFYV